MKPVEILLERVAARMQILGLNDNQLSQAVAGNGYVMRDLRRGWMPKAPRIMKLAQVRSTTSIVDHSPKPLPPRPFCTFPSKPDLTARTRQYGACPNKLLTWGFPHIF